MPCSLITPRIGSLKCARIWHIKIRPVADPLHMPPSATTHSWITVAKLLTELTVLGGCVTASMGIMKANVKEEGPDWKMINKPHTVKMQNAFHNSITNPTILIATMF